MQTLAAGLGLMYSAVLAHRTRDLAALLPFGLLYGYARWGAGALRPVGQDAAEGNAAATRVLAGMVGMVRDGGYGAGDDA